MKQNDVSPLGERFSIRSNGNRHESGDTPFSQPLAASKGPKKLHPGPHRILLAEDDLEMRALLAQSLRWAGYRVTECVDGWDLLSHLGSYLIPQGHERIDLVITDIRMPGLTGLEILRGTRGTRDFPPLILITAFGDEETHAEAARLGAAMLDKPFDMNEMLATVAALISGAC